MPQLHLSDQQFYCVLRYFLYYRFLSSLFQPLTHRVLVLLYDSINLSQHWLRYWLVAWRHQAITLTNVDLSSKNLKVFVNIYLRAISQEILMNLICNRCSKITLPRLLPQGQWVLTIVNPLTSNYTFASIVVLQHQAICSHKVKAGILLTYKTKFKLFTIHGIVPADVLAHTSASLLGHLQYQRSLLSVTWFFSLPLLLFVIHNMVCRQGISIIFQSFRVLTAAVTPGVTLRYQWAQSVTSRTARLWQNIGKSRGMGRRKRVALLGCQTHHLNPQVIIPDANLLTA